MTYDISKKYNSYSKKKGMYQATTNCVKGLPTKDEAIAWIKERNPSARLQSDGTYFVKTMMMFDIYKIIERK